MANFTYAPTDVVVYQEVHFYDHSTDQNGTVVSREWDFGDATTSNATTPTHKYTLYGDYLVTLTVIDEYDNQNYTEASIHVRKINTSLSLNKPNSTIQGSAVSLIATLTDEYGKHVDGMEIDFYIDGEEGQLIGSDFTDIVGRASINYQPPGSGIFNIKATFNGTEAYAEANSEPQTLEVGYNIIPYAVLAATIILIMSIVYYYLRRRTPKEEKEEPSTPEAEEEK
jgi:PKD repeat protein